MPIWERFEVDVEGSVGSNRPAFCECFRMCPLTKEVLDGEALPPGVDGGKVNGDGALRGASIGEWAAATDLAATAAVDSVGREKFCRLPVLEFACDVKEA